MIDKSQNFWKWFKQNNSAYLFLNEVDAQIKEKLMNELMAELHKYCDKLFFEIGGHPKKDKELIITAEGNTEYFQQVETLIAEAPSISSWIFIAFIPPAGEDFELNYENVKLKASGMWFHPLENSKQPNAIGIKVCTGNYELEKSNKWLKPAVYKALDTLLGEKSFALDIAYVEIDQTPDDPEENGMIAFIELPAYINWKKSTYHNTERNK